jgi:DNA-binding protein HU-beta
MPKKRTVMRSRSGKKLYVIRDAKGRFKDIQSYKKAHSQDIKRKSKAEKAAAKKTAKKKPAKKKIARKK